MITPAVSDRIHRSRGVLPRTTIAGADWVNGDSNDTTNSIGKWRSTLEKFGLSLRIQGSHHIYFKDGVEEILNLQPKGAKAKAYQVKQVREVITKYRLVEADEE